MAEKTTTGINKISNKERVENWAIRSLGLLVIAAGGYGIYKLLPHLGQSVDIYDFAGSALTIGILAGAMVAGAWVATQKD